MSSFKSLILFSFHNSFPHHSDFVRNQRNVLSHEIGTFYVMLKRGVYVTNDIIDSEADFYFVCLFCPGRMKMLRRRGQWISSCTFICNRVLI